MAALTRSRVILIGILGLSVAQVAAQTITARYVNLGIAHPGSYDYAPSVLWDDTARVWRAWWCGYNGPANPGDAMFYATSASGQPGTWSAPIKVLAPSATGWDSRHVCDPTVLSYPPGRFAAYKFVVWYVGASDVFHQGCPAESGYGCDAAIGVAYGHSPATLQKYAGNPIMHCSAPLTYGCGHPSLVVVGNEVRGTLVRDDGATVQLSAIVSSDGVTFAESRWPSPEAWGGGVPGVDVMRDAAGAWYGVYTGNSFETVMRAAGFGLPWTILSSTATASSPTIRSNGPGWWRTHTGARPSGVTRISTGVPSQSDVPWDVNLQELRAIDWRNLP